VLDALFGVLSYVPPALAAGLAWYLSSKTWSRGHWYPDHWTALVAGLWASAVISAGFATWMLYALSVELGKPTASWVTSLTIVVLPLFVLAVALAAGAVGWGVTQVAIEAHRVSSGASGVGVGLLRSLFPAFVIIAVVYATHVQTRPSMAQRIWQLAASPSGEPKLRAMYRSASDRQDQTVLEALAKAPQLPPTLLRDMAGEANVDVRACVANNPNTPIEVLGHLARDESADVRRAVVFNRAATVSLLTLLAKDGAQDVREAAELQLKGKLAE
jgi:hypothetical protein